VCFYSVVAAESGVPVDDMQKLVVIGAGAAGSAVVGECLRNAQPGQLDLTWIRGRQAPGRGVAYSTTAEHHLLNVRAANMGLFADDAGEFIAFARARGWPVEACDFAPRVRYADYLQDTLAREIAKAGERHVAVRLLADEAISVRGDDRAGYAVVSAAGERMVADGVVLAIGALPPTPLAEVTAAARAHPAYAADPWHWVPPGKVPERVVVLGTGLSAVDALQSAARLWPNAQLIAVSRHGHLPFAHNAVPGEPYEQQAALIEALREAPAVARWLHEIRAAMAESGVEWRSIVDGLRMQTPQLWRALNDDERKRFLRHLRWLWEAVRHRLPQQTANELAHLCEQMRLEIVAGRIRAIDVHANARNRLDVRVQLRGTSDMRRFAADLVIQATGFNLSIDATDHALVRQMVSEGVVHADALDLGLAADPEGRLLSVDGVPARGLRCLGTLLRGSIWECSGLPEIRNLAKAIARDMPAELREVRKATHSRMSMTANALVAA